VGRWFATQGKLTNAAVVDEGAVSELLQAHDGVVSRRQLLALDVTDSEIEG